MEQLNELIRQFCPCGVEILPLENVCRISKGVQFNKSDMHASGTYPVINGGVTASGYIEQYNQDENTITISQGGASAGYVNWIKTRFWAGAHCYVLKPTDKVLNRYLFHFVKSKEIKLQECQYGAGIPALAKTTVASLKIPLPPLPVQQEIVRILDSFTELTAELNKNLEEELAARRKQYEHYRDELLTAPQGGQEMKFDDLFEFQNGFAFKSSLFKESGCPILRITNIQDRRIDTEKMVYFSPDDYKENLQAFTVLPGDIVVAMSGATTGKIGVNHTDKVYYLNQRVGKFSPKAGIDKRYLYHLLLQNSNKLLEISVGSGAQPNLSSEKMKKLTARVPALSEQKRIATILDKLDTLCNDLISGLPAEIAARQKQYEYYRDKLLTFKKLEG